MTLLCNILSEIYHRTRAKSIVELAIAPVLCIINALPSQAHPLKILLELRLCKIDGKVILAIFLFFDKYHL
ncbi:MULTISPECIES: hypothetical protein [Fischerella]|uniref:hypothetical protein n=1 Tax=Fischerella TaxID=1190 RepID=UPI0002F2ED00|nr:MULTISPECIES: hypothetical protein [Fischerella]